MSRLGDGAMRGVVVAGTQSGVGKTSVSLGMMAALRRRGLAVQPFKVGPDFIDPGHHCRASGRISRNLDGWMLPRAANLESFRCHAARADVAVVEGVMGLFDGYDGRSEAGSTAEIAKWLGAPVVLVVDAWALARSAAALVQGYTRFDPELRVAGIVLNKVAGQAHLDWLRQALEGASDVPVLGGLPKDAAVAVPERHLGLLMAEEDRLGDAYIERLAELVEEHLDLDLLLALSELPPTPAPSAERFSPPSSARIGVVRDEAFCFYYQDNLELLERFGAELVEFSALGGRLPAGLDGLYIGGGYPELHAAALAENAELRREIAAFARAGGPIYAECGGLIYLSQGIEADGRRHPLCGVFPFWTRMRPTLKLAYAEVRTLRGAAPLPADRKARGHFFHFSEIAGANEAACCYEVRTYGAEPVREGFRIGNALASYVHLHFASDPELARGFVHFCAGGGR